MTELRSSLRYGSRHEGHYVNEAEARKVARNRIRAAGNVGRITAVVDDVVYYTEYEEDL